ncbi:hypothetical protein AAE478_009202 [Parahypoxylon ruwenzoriense]
MAFIQVPFPATSQAFNDGQFGNPYCNEAVVCVVCGMVCKPTVPSALSEVSWDDEQRPGDWTHPSLVKAKPGFRAWCKDPSSATAYKRDDSDIIELFEVQQFRGGATGFVIVPKDENQDPRVSINTRDSEMFIPIHRACFRIAEQFCKYQSNFKINFRDLSRPNGGQPSSIGHLYEIWMKRARTTLPGLNGPLRSPITEPTGYAGALVKTSLWDYVHFMNSDYQKFQACPVGDSYTTTITILQRATKTPTEDWKFPYGEYRELQMRISKLPKEIVLRIAEALQPFHLLSSSQLVCTRVFPPEFWRAKLFGGEMIPWLFDLDESVIEQVSARLTATAPLNLPVSLGDIDWELLCRQLGQRNVCHRWGLLGDAEPFLWNRHRIWKLLSRSRLLHRSL